MSSRVAVIGGGWAGLAAAVALSEDGHHVTLIEMAPQLGGRARSVEHEGERFDNGQHILIGAYAQSLALLRSIGVDPDDALLRIPLQLHYPDRAGLALPPGAPMPSFARGVLAHRGWPLGARLRLLAVAGGWLLNGFRCEPDRSVAQLCAGLPAVVNTELIEPLCVAALNTPAREASAAVFLRVLRDALFSGRGGSDLLLPRRGLSALLAEPAAAWLRGRGADLRLGRRANALQRDASGWQVDGEAFDAVVLACPSGEAARMVRPLAPDWAAQAEALRFEPIVTVYLDSPGSSLPAPIVALTEGLQAPAQFAFDLGQLGQQPGRFAFVVSGASAWIERGLEATGAMTLEQATDSLRWAAPPTVRKVLAEKRATFACAPGLNRPPAVIAPGLWAAGDYVAGPYPATLEGAVRAGQAAAREITRTTFSR